jgi:F0F1-type ATP synthase alpha subunit
MHCLSGKYSPCALPRCACLFQLAVLTLFYAERVRDNGGHALVLLDDISPLASAWGILALHGLGSLGQEVVRT